MPALRLLPAWSVAAEISYSASAPQHLAVRQNPAHQLCSSPVRGLTLRSAPTRYGGPACPCGALVYAAPHGQAVPPPRSVSAQTLGRTQMILGEIIPALRKASSDPVVLRLIELLDDWRQDASTTEDLRQWVERYIGNSWTTSTQEHEAVYALWSAFRDECILGRGGMTMNERLYCFDLLEAWDSASDQEARTVIQQKVDFPSFPSP